MQSVVVPATPPKSSSSTTATPAPTSSNATISVEASKASSQPPLLLQRQASSLLLLVWFAQAATPLLHRQEALPQQICTFSSRDLLQRLRSTSRRLLFSSYSLSLIPIIVTLLLSKRSSSPSDLNPYFVGLLGGLSQQKSQSSPVR